MTTEMEMTVVAREESNSISTTLVFTLPVCINPDFIFYTQKKYAIITSNGLITHMKVYS